MCWAWDARAAKAGVQHIMTGRKIPVSSKHSRRGSSPKTEMFLGEVLINECLCGARVRPGDPQKIVWHAGAKVFYRRCRKCLRHTEVAQRQ